MLSKKERRAAHNAVGGDVLDHDINVAIEKWQDADLISMQKTLGKALDVFTSAGGRGVANADEIDLLRIAIAVREVRENAS